LKNNLNKFAHLLNDKNITTLATINKYRKSIIDSLFHKAEYMSYKKTKIAGNKSWIVSIVPYRKARSKHVLLLKKTKVSAMPHQIKGAAPAIGNQLSWEAFMKLPISRYQDKNVSTNSLTPCQSKTNRNFRTATDFRVVQLLKHAEPSEFHSVSEYYHALLLEADPSVTRYVPQPYRLMIGKRRYTPDCYLVRDGQVDIVELRPNAKFDESRGQALKAFFRLHDMRFLVIPNEEVMNRRTEALNWQMIIQMLVCHHDLDTTSWELELLEAAFRRGIFQFGDHVLRQDRSSCRPKEIALLRLLHKGKLAANLTKHRFSFSTELWPCP
tara:strand:+ start:1079 stop:2056 length:978 start_codon:yes stop_codon:yes gene_type:complete